MRETDPLEVLHAFRQKYQTQADAAAALNISLPYFNDMMNMRRDISPRILEKLGLRRVVVKEKAS